MHLTLRSIPGRIWRTAIPVLLFLWGMWSFPYALLDPDHALIPGDLGDARFNNYVLEHFSRYMAGKEDGFWDARFMHPEKNVIARSDNLLGTAPIYDAFRRLGWDRESSFQLWILALFALNYWGAFMALRGWRTGAVVAACGAFIYAFGIHQIGHLNHVQVYPRFMLPIALLAWWRVLEGGRGLWWYVAALATAYQFWCGIYLGYILTYGLLVLTVAHVAVRRGGRWLHQLREKRSRLHALGASVLGALLLLPLMRPYLAIAERTGMRSFAEVAASVPRPVSLFFSDPAAENWRDLAWHSQYAFPEWWHQMHFMGGVAWAGVLVALVLLALHRTATDRRRDLLVLLLAWALSILLCLHIGNVFTYRAVYALPGFSALRAIDRFVLVQSFFFVLLLAQGMGRIRRPAWLAGALALVLPVATVLDLRVAVDWTTRYDKHASRHAIDQVDRYIQEQYDGSSRAIAWCPVRPPLADDQEHRHTIATNLTAMLAAQQRDIPIVNGYSGSYPESYMPFFDMMDRATLDAWLDRNGVAPSTVQCIDNLGLPRQDQFKTALLTRDGLPVQLRDRHAGELVIGGDSLGLGSCYTVVRLVDGRLVLLASNDRFVTADLSDGDLALRADAPVAGDHCFFRTQELEDGNFVLQADNGRFVEREGSGRLHAWADSLQQAARFRFAPLPAGVR
ncbi:MAG: hypothetical protein KDC03_14080 [Flavobacteriales bacterium]|nr:hypothetical protein [Flavobacteriales bacterium]